MLSNDRMSLRAAVCLLVALILPGCSVPERQQRQASFVIPLKTYFRDLKTAELLLGDRKVTFLVDSAGGRTLISEELAHTIGCAPFGRDVAYRMTGEPVVFANCDSLEASAAGFRLSLRPVAVFDVNRLLPPELPHLDGVLALDAFRGAVLSLDWSHDRLIVHSAGDAVRALAQNGVPIRIATGENGAGLAALVPVTGSSHELWFLLDSGNIRGTLVARYVQDQGLLPRATGTSVAIAIGSRTPVNLAPVIDEAINLDGVLGTEYLKLQTITIDLRGAR